MNPPLDVDALLDDPSIRIVVCCGSGGVGKTTTSAALAVRVAVEAAAMSRLRAGPGPRLELPNLVDGVDLGTLYELADALVAQGVGASTAVRA